MLKVYSKRFEIPVSSYKQETIVIDEKDFLFQQLAFSVSDPDILFEIKIGGRNIFSDALPTNVFDQAGGKVFILPSPEKILGKTTVALKAINNDAANAADFYFLMFGQEINENEVA